jgi:phosphomannomutase
VVVDTVNGAASFALPALLESLGCEVVRIHTTPDGTFPRGTEPVPANLADLSDAVRDHGADLGLATDPDADRLALVDETGTPIGEEYTQVIAMDGYFRRTGSGKPVVTNLSSSRLVDIMAESHGAEVLRASVGEVNVVNMMRSVGAEIGGEGNGGVILAECHLGRDSLVGSALVLDRLAQEREPLSAVVAQWPRLTMIKEKVSIKGSKTKDMLAQLTATFKGADRVDTTDGIKINQGAGWVHVRQSNTEPVVRIIAEAPTEAEVRKLIDSARTAILDGAAA